MALWCFESEQLVNEKYCDDKLGIVITIDIKDMGGWMKSIYVGTKMVIVNGNVLVTFK